MNRFSPVSGSASVHCTSTDTATAPRWVQFRIWPADDRFTLTDDAMLLLEGHTSAVYTLAFSQDGGLLASGSQKGEVILWDGGGERRDAIGLRQDLVNAVEFHPNGRTLVVGGAWGLMESP